MTTEKRVLVESKYEVIPWSGCWLWLGAVDSCGYGSVHRSFGARGTGKSFGAHRLAYEEANGPIPTAKHVLHRCDVPSCINPAHLFLGTHRDNMRDAATKGKYKGGANFGKGAQHSNAKWTQDVYDYWMQSKEPHYIAGKKTGASGNTVGAFRRARGWTG